MTVVTGKRYNVVYIVYIFLIYGQQNGIRSGFSLSNKVYFVYCHSQNNISFVIVGTDNKTVTVHSNRAFTHPQSKHNII